MNTRGCGGLGGVGNRNVCFCDLRFFFFFEEACSRERVGGEMGMVELVGFVEVVVLGGGIC